MDADDPDNPPPPTRPASRAGPAVTRRGVLLGTATASLGRGRIAAAATAEPLLSVELENRDGRALLVRYAPAGTVVPFVLRLPASFFGDPDSPMHPARFALARVARDGDGRPPGWEATLRYASFPDLAPFSMTIAVGWPQDGGAPGMPTLAFNLGLPGGAVTLGTAADPRGVPLEAWMSGAGGTAEISGPLRPGQARLLASLLFGDALDVGSGAGMTLGFHRLGAWTFAGPGLSVLPGGEAGLRTAKIFFGPLSDQAGILPPPGTPKAAVGAAPLPADTVDLFAGQGAPPAIAASAKRVIYAAAMSEPAGAAAAIGFGAAPGGSVALRLSPNERCRLAWRKSANVAPYLACAGTMQARVTPTGAGAGAVSLPSGAGTLWMQLGAAGARLAAAVTPAPVAGFDVATDDGAFDVVPLPAIIERPGIKPAVPALRVAAVGTRADLRTLAQFAAPFALRSAAVGLTSDGGETFSRLAFDQAECLFRIAGADLSHDWTMASRPETTPPQAEAIIYLGPPPSDMPPARLALNRATLSVRRPRDLLALTYRFQDLVLERSRAGAEGAPWWVKPDRAMAAAVAYRRPPDDTGVPPLQGGGKTAQDGPPPAGGDPRPLIAVEFPAQHVAEQAFFRRLPAEPNLPPAPPPGVPEAQAAILRDGTPAVAVEPVDTPAAALANRTDVRKLLRTGFLASVAADSAFSVFAVRYEAAAKAEGLASDEQVYVGPGFLEPRSTRVARRVARAIESEIANRPEPSGLNDESQITRLLRAVPEVDLLDEDTAALRRAARLELTASEPDIEGRARNEGAAAMYVAARERLKASRSRDYAGFADFYSRSANSPFLGRANYARYVLGLPAPQQTTAIKAVLDLVDGYDATVEDGPAPPEPGSMEARISGPSRLVFRVAMDDFEGGRPDPPGRPAGAFPFTVAGLTNWGSFDLEVVRRSQKLFEPYPGGRETRRWDRVEARDAGDYLAFQGLSRRGTWRLGDLVQPGGPIAPGNMSGRQRMAEIAAAATEAPHWNQTAIEIPFRLIMSPAQDASWRTPLPSPGMRVDAARPVPLWHASLYEAPGGSTLRAIWSPDFRPEALVDPGAGMPPPGPFAPWAMARDTTASTTAGAEPFRASLDAADRHQLVTLSGLHGLPVGGSRREDGTLVDPSQFNPPAGYELRDAMAEALVDGGPLADRSAIYRPKALGARELALTAIGGTLDLDTDFEPPAGARTRDGAALFDALSVERWRHLAVLGRDVYVEVVYKGYLFPLGHRASLVKVTERRFLAHPTATGANGPPIAYLVQRMFLRVGVPVKRYPAIRQPNDGRRWPVGQLEILTKTTPDLLDPMDASGTPDPVNGSFLADNGRIFLTGRGGVTRGLVFWPRVRASESGDVQFELQVDRRGAPIRMPLIFVDNTAANDGKAMAALARYYNGLPPEAASGRVMDHAGLKRRYAPEQQPDDTALETATWTLGAEGAQDTPPEGTSFHNTDYSFTSVQRGADQPPFYPLVQTANVHIAQVDRLIGARTGNVDVSFDGAYTASGFQAPDAVAPRPDLYLMISGKLELNPGDAGDRVGGAARPNATYVALSRSRGPISMAPPASQPPVAASPGAPPQAQATPGAPPAFNDAAQPSLVEAISRLSPAKLFNLDAKILGVVTIGAVLDQAIGDGFSKAPVLKEVTQYASALLSSTESDVGAAVAKVRDGLLDPLRDALADLAREWTAATGKPGEEAREAIDRLQAFYPDVGRSFLALQASVDGAIAASTGVTALSELLAHFAGIYAAGRQFVTAIERVAADPVAPVRAKLRDAFKDQFGPLLQAAGLKSLSDALGQLKPGELVRAVLGSEDGLAWRSFVFTPPVAAGPDALAVNRQVQQALTEAVRSAPWPQAGDGAAEVIVTSLETRLTDQALLAALPGWNAAARAERIRQVRGLLYNDAIDAVGGFLAAADRIEAYVIPDAAPLSSLVSLQQQFDALFLHLRELIQPVLQSGASAACAAAIAPLVALAAAVRPDAGALRAVPAAADALKASLGQAAADTGSFAAALDPADPLQPSLFAARTALTMWAAQLDAPEAAFRAAADRLQDALGRLAPGDPAGVNLCEAGAAGLLAAPLDALAALQRLRTDLLAGIAGLAGAIGPPAGIDQLATLFAPLVGETTAVTTIRLATAAAADGAILAAARIVTALVNAAEQATTLKSDLSAIKGVPGLDQAVTEATAAKARLITSVNTRLTVPASGIVTLADLDQLKILASDARGILDDVGKTLVQMAEQKLLRILAAQLAAGAKASAAIAAPVLSFLRMSLTALATVQRAIADRRDAAARALGAGPSSPTGRALQDLLGDVSRLTPADLRQVLVVSTPPNLVDPRAAPGSPRAKVSPPPADFLRSEADELNAYANAGTVADLAAIDALFRDWGAGRSSVALLAQNLGFAAGHLLSGDLGRLIDLDRARRRIEEKLKEMIPARVALGYDLGLDLRPFGSLLTWGGDKRLTIAVAASVDLLSAEKRPSFTSTATLCPFDIDLFGVVKLMFDGARFVNDSAKGSDFHVTYRDFQLGPQAAFLKPLEALLNPKGSGPYVRPMQGGPGIEAGFSLDLGIISLGELSFANVSLNASCALPFDDSQAVFTASIGRRDKPFLISALPYMGGGFLALHATGNRITGFEASFEFGGGGAFKFGLLEGQGRISTGIYVNQFNVKLADGTLRQGTIIEGFFYAGGEAHLACFSIAASLMVRVAQQLGGSMQGMALFTYSFSVGLFDVAFHIQVGKTIGAGFSGSQQSALESKTRFAGPGVPQQIRQDGKVLRSTAVSQATDWRAYREYFTDEIDGAAE